MPALQDLTGERFGRLLVLKFSHRKWEKRIYLCSCDCGNKCLVDTSSLKSGHTTSCGCFHSERTSQKLTKDLTGMRFGKLLVLGIDHKDSKNIYWKCVCDCGKTCAPAAGNLSRGGAKSCGCTRFEKIKNLAIFMTGIKNPNWKGGRKVYPKEWNEEIKEDVRNRDERRCRFPNCSFTDVGLRRRLDVHHIDGDKSNCKPSNLISLCIPHHRKVELDPVHWIDYFLSITRDYE